MILLQVPRGVGPLNIEVPDEVTPRSCEGSLHLRRNSTKEVTSAEWDWLKKAHKDVAERLVVVAEGLEPRSSKVKDKASKPEPIVPDPPVEEPKSKSKKKLKP